MIVASQISHPAFECAYSNGIYIIISITTIDSVHGTLKCSWSRIFVHWMTIFKGIDYAGICTGYQSHPNEKVFHNIEYSLVNVIIGTVLTKKNWQNQCFLG